MGLEVFPENGCATLGFWTWDSSIRAMLAYVNMDQTTLGRGSTALSPIQAFHW